MSYGFEPELRVGPELGALGGMGRHAVATDELSSPKGGILQIKERRKR